MKTNLIVVSSFLTFLCACSSVQKSDSYLVEGVLPDSASNGKMIYVMRYDDNKYIDSTVVEGNRFAFSGKNDTASFCRIDVTGRLFANFILENGHIKVDLVEYNKPSGTPLNEEMAKLATMEENLYIDMETQRREFKEKYTDEKVLTENWLKYIEQWRLELGEKCTALYQNHQNDAVGQFLMYTVFMREIDLDLQDSIISQFGPWLKSTRVVRDKVKRIESVRKTAEGKPFVDIQGEDKDGKQIALSDFIGKGNYVLMDMWASWCGPCKSEVPNLAHLYEKYNKRGLTVVGMFVWDKKENLEKSVTEEKIVWPQIVDSKNMAMDLYGAEGIPFIVLFAPDGAILKRDLRGKNMIDIVDELMKDNKEKDSFFSRKTNLSQIWITKVKILLSFSHILRMYES